jgi:hypothetical protein
VGQYGDLKNEFAMGKVGFPVKRHMYIEYGASGATKATKHQASVERRRPNERRRAPKRALYAKTNTSGTTGSTFDNFSAADAPSRSAAWT